MTTKRAAIFNRRNRHRDRMMPAAAKVIARLLRKERANLLRGGSIDATAWEKALYQVRYSTAEEIWRYTVDEILPPAKAIDVEVVRRISNNPGALRAVAVGARNAAAREVAKGNELLSRAAAESTENYRDVIRALYSKDKIASRAQLAARNEVLDAAAEFQHAAAEATQEPLRKQWLSVQDSRVRPPHASADARYREGSDPGPLPLQQPFIVDGEELMRPRDPAGSAGNVINCRCQELFIIVEDPPPPPPGPPEWKPSMPAADAERWAEGSAVPEQVYHASVFGDKIRAQGFKRSRRSMFGRGVYTANADDVAGWRNYALENRRVAQGAGAVEELPIRVKADKVLEWKDAPATVETVASDVRFIDDLDRGIIPADVRDSFDSIERYREAAHYYIDRATKTRQWARSNADMDFLDDVYNAMRPADGSDGLYPFDAIPAAAEKHGYDALRVSFTPTGPATDLAATAGGEQLVVFDIEKVTVVIP